MPALLGTMTGAATLTILGTMSSPSSEVASYDIRFQVEAPIEEAAREAFVTSFDGIDPNNDGAQDIGVLTKKNTPVTVSPTSTGAAFNAVKINQSPGAGTASISGASISYTPDPNYKGVDTIGFTLKQGAAIVGLGMIHIGVLETTPVTGIDGLPDYSLLSELADCSTAAVWRDRVNSLIQQHNKYVNND